MTRKAPDLDIPATALGRLVHHGSALMVAVVDADGRVEVANRALSQACGGDLTGAALDTLLTPESHAELHAHVESGADRALLVQLSPPRGEPFSLWVFVEPRAAGFALAGEPPWEDHRALEVQLQAVNAELAELSRSHAREGRRLKQALAELRDSHWQLEKIAEVLPMCLECRAVQTTPNTWEHVSDFLVRSANFLSHGYCARCASELDEKLEPQGGGP